MTADEGRGMQPTIATIIYPDFELAAGSQCTPALHIFVFFLVPVICIGLCGLGVKIMILCSNNSSIGWRLGLRVFFFRCNYVGAGA